MITSLTSPRRLDGPLTSLIVLILLASLVGSLSGCSVQTPSARVRSASLTSLSLSNMKIKLGMNLRNPNTFALPISQIDWDLKVFERPLADGIVRLDREVPAQGSSRFDVPLTISLKRASANVSDLLSGRRIPFKINGVVALDSPVGEVTTRFVKTGRWDNPLSALRLPMDEAEVDLEELRLPCIPLN